MLVRTTAQIRTIVPVNARVEFGTFEPYIAAAETQIIIPVLGQELYAELDAVADDSGTDDQKALLKKVRYSLINLCMFKGFDMLNVTFDESGFERVSKETGLYRYQEENLKGVFKNEGYNGIDLLLEFLQVNLSKYAKFKTSEFYLDIKGSFFPTTMVFNKIYGIGNSRLVFLQIARFFDQVIDFQIKPLLGSALYDKVLVEMKKADNQDPDLMALVPYIRKPLAFLAVAGGMDELGMLVTEKGLLFETQIAGMVSHVQTTQASDAQMFSLLEKAKVNGARYKEMLLDHLKTNANKYPDFTQTDLDNTNPYRRDNSDKKTFWA